MFRNLIMGKNGNPARAIDGWIVILLIVALLLLFLWPAFSTVERRSLERLVVYAGRFLDYEMASSPLFTSSDQHREGELLARIAHRIDFQIKKTKFDLFRAKALVAESNQPQKVLALLAYYQLLNFPEGNPRSPEQKQAVEMMDWVCSKALKEDPANSYFVYCQAATSALKGDFNESLRFLRTANAMPAFKSYLTDINRSEAIISLDEGGSLARQPYHGLDGTHPFNDVSRWLFQTTRELVKKYNQEKALDFALLHLGLSEKIWRDASTVRQAVLGEQMCLRGLRSMSKKSFDLGEQKSLEDEFLEFLDDIGERQKERNYQDFFQGFQQVKVKQWLKKTRMAQAKLHSDSLTLPLYLTAMLLVALPGWLLFRWRGKDDSAYGEKAGLWGFIAAVVPGTIFWSVWPFGLRGAYLFISIAVSSVCWVSVLLIIARSSQASWLNLIRSGFRGGLLGLLLLWLGTGIEQGLSTQNAATWIQRVGSIPWVDQK